MKLKTEGDETMTIGCIVNDRTEISRYAKLYLKEALKDEIIDIDDAYHIFRGYSNIVEKLSLLGADVQKI